jgi:uncharacterized LabA/DUF88 family protein
VATDNKTHAFVDGAYLRRLAVEAKRPLPNPRDLVVYALGREPLVDWCTQGGEGKFVRLDRLSYYDARPEPSEPISEMLQSYWDAIELLPDCDLGFGNLRGRPRHRRQKGVDTLIAVDMLAGAFDHIFDVAILVAGDADFVPIVQEVKRRGIKVGLIAENGSTSADLRRAVDRYHILPTINDDHSFPPFHRPGHGFWTAE